MATTDEVLGRSMFADNAASSSPLIPPIMGVQVQKEQE